MTSQGVPGKLVPYYANLHFLQTLSLYENANIIDVRPSHLIPNVLPDGTILEGNEKSSIDDLPKKPKKKIDTPPSNGVYEMMSFNQSEFPSTSGDNYLLMQPGTSDGRGELTVAEVPSTSSQTSGAVTSAPVGASASTSCDTIPEGETTSNSESSSILPLRPFMPVLLPFHEHSCEIKDSAECDESCKSVCGGRKCECQSRSSRSNSLGDIKISTLRRGRSSSTDGRQEGTTDDGGAGTASPKSTPIRKHPILTKLTLRSKEKSFSTDEITPPSSAPSSPDSLFLESIQKYPFHRSADCLQLNEEYRLSEEDLSQDPEVIMSQSMDKSTCRTPLSIKRSSSVPCKTNASNQQQGQQNSASSTDSGISTHLPANHSNQGAIFSHFIAYHGSLPRRHSGNAANRHPVPDRKFSGNVTKSHCNQQDQKQDQSKMIFISECKQCHQFVTSPEGVLVLDAKSMTSSSSSDMSDYIESLSLCSRSSSGSGSSGCGGISGSEYIRTDDLCNALMKIPTSCTSSLRPRSGKEYHTFDRVIIQDGCPYIPVADCSHLNLPCLKSFTDDTEQQEQTDESVNANINSSSESTNNNIINNNNANKTNSPSPGYVSSSPGNPDFLSSPEKTSQFTFPKDTAKELNYLEVVSVGESEPSSPIVKQGTVQYAVIDVVATNAARKLSTERAQLRNEVKSPTPTECSPKHSSLEDTSANDKK